MSYIELFISTILNCYEIVKIEIGIVNASVEITAKRLGHQLMIYLMM